MLAGRKAAACSVVPDYCISIGVEILKKEVKMIAINLYGEKIRHMAYEIDFENFFQKVRMKEPYCLEQWNTFLTDLARAINMLHLVYDTDFILGGYISQYLCDEDLGFIHEKIQQMTPFTEEQDFLRISKMPEHNISIGAALPYIQAFLNNFGI